MRVYKTIRAANFIWYKRPGSGTESQAGRPCPFWFCAFPYWPLPGGSWPGNIVGVALKIQWPGGRGWAKKVFGFLDSTARCLYFCKNPQNDFEFGKLKDFNSYCMALYWKHKQTHMGTILFFLFAPGSVQTGDSGGRLPGFGNDMGVLRLRPKYDREITINAFIRAAFRAFVAKIWNEP